MRQHQDPITVEQIREWCGTEGTTIIVRPIINLAGHDPVDSYEIPDRHRRQVTLRDPHCAFPHCHQPASRCDLDHAKPYDQGGPTCPCNLVPLCRGHHRAKTHAGWRYVILDPAAPTSGPARPATSTSSTTAAPATSPRTGG